MTNVKILAGTLTASRADRTVAGLLLPYGEVGRTNLGKFQVPRGAFELPPDPSVVTLNRQHDAQTPIGRAVTLTDTTAGVVASFAVAKTPEGDAYLDEVERGKRNALSAEVADVVIRAGKALGGRLYAAAAVTAGAFPSATLMAADVGELEDEDEEPAEEPAEETTEDDQPSDEAPDGAGSEADVAEDTTAPEVEQDEQENDEEREPLKAARPRSLGGKPKVKGKALFASLAGQRPGQAATLMAALDNMIPADVLPAQEKQWLGEIYATRTYERRFASLVQHADLNGMQAIGWKFTSGKTPAVAAYNGFPNQPNSNEVKTEAVTLTASRIAGAGAVDRAFLDFPTPEFWAGYFREQTNSYERTLDGIVRDVLIAGATDVEAGEVPEGVATAAAYLVDGAMSIIDAEIDLPSFAIVGSNLYRELLLTRADDLLTYLNMALGLEEGTLNGGNFRIVPSSVETLASKVLVGARTAATVFELPGTPVRVDTVNIATGGVERGVFGYHAELINDPRGLALVAEAEGGA